LLSSRKKKPLAAQSPPGAGKRQRNGLDLSHKPAGIGSWAFPKTTQRGNGSDHFIF
jgi:hypothetical protein